MNRLSEDIRLGAIMGIRETHSAFITKNNDCGCALGTAALVRGERAIQRSWADCLALFIKLYPDYPEKIIFEVNSRHLDGESRLEIADWLEREVEPQLFGETQESEVEPKVAT